MAEDYQIKRHNQLAEHTQLADINQLKKHTQLTETWSTSKTHPIIQLSECHQLKDKF